MATITQPVKSGIITSAVAAHTEGGFRACESNPDAMVMSQPYLCSVLETPNLKTDGSCLKLGARYFKDMSFSKGETKHLRRGTFELNYGKKMIQSFLVASPVVTQMISEN